MREVIFACVAVAGFMSAASADELGIASYYQNPHDSGLVAAHKTLPFGTRVKVFNLDNGRSAIVKIVTGARSFAGASSMSRPPPRARSAFGRRASRMCGSSGSEVASTPDRLGHERNEILNPIVEMEGGQAWRREHILLQNDWHEVGLATPILLLVRQRVFGFLDHPLRILCRL